MVFRSVLSAKIKRKISPTARWTPGAIFLNRFPYLSPHFFDSERDKVFQHPKSDYQRNPMSTPNEEEKPGESRGSRGPAARQWSADDDQLRSFSYFSGFPGFGFPARDTCPTRGKLPRGKTAVVSYLRNYMAGHNGERGL